MNTIRYNGQNVYTTSNMETSFDDLDKARKKPANIIDAYFMKVDGDRNVVRQDFDKKAVLKNNQGLHVLVNCESEGQAAVTISGLNRITGFLIDNSVLGKDLSVLKGREVTSYNSGMVLLGIGIKNK